MKNRRFHTLFIILILGLVMAGFPAFAQEGPTTSEQAPGARSAPVLPPSTPQLIESAYKAGQISRETSNLYLAYALSNDPRLPPEYISSTPWDGTLPLLALQESFELMSPGREQPANSITNPPNDNPVPGFLFNDPDWQIYRHAGTGKVRFLSTKSGAAIPQQRPLKPGAAPEDAAINFLSSYGEMFGLHDPALELRVMKQRRLTEGVPRSFVRFQQVHAGIPVLGGELIVQLDAKNDVRSVSGEVLPDLTLDVSSRVSAQASVDIALSKVAQDYGLPPGELTASIPELWIYNPILLGGPGPHLSSLVWRVEVSPIELAPIRELVLVDAELGAVALHINQVPTARNRMTYDANNGTTLPGTLVCNESNPSCSGGDTHEVATHTFTGNTYDFYMANHGRDSIDNAGMTLVSTVHYGSGYDNAFWNGKQMVYGDAYDFPLGDDVVGHELTHGVTDYESQLFYYYQSGAINESFSDLWGEFIDQYQATGNDSGDTVWEIGEDINWPEARRNMQDPTIFGDPDRMSSLNYYCNQANLGGPGDNGGVHTNSGVNNKAAYLMTNGEIFNGYNVTGLGFAKVADLFYEVQTNLLTSAADYADLYNALIQACNNVGYSASDCQEVQDAVNATEMNQQPAGCPALHAPVCDAGTPSHIFFDDIESGGSNWTAGSYIGTPYWFVPQTSSTIGLAEPYATSGVGNIWGVDTLGGTSDTYLAMNSDISLPAVSYMHFNHSFGFESNDSASSRYDGGILEYSTNGGSTWVDAGSLFTHNGYNGTLASGNPLGTIPAFSADSRGYISSRLNLSPLAGQNVRFRFRIGTNSAVYDFGWFIDDVRIYTCVTTADFKLFLPVTLKNFTHIPPSPPAAPTGLNATTVSHTEIQLTWIDNANNETGFSIERSTDGSTWGEIDTVGINVNSYNNTGLNPDTTYHYRVRAYNGVGNSGYSNVAFATTYPEPIPAICNGDFELGTNCWTEYSAQGWDVIINTGFPGSITPRSGSWAAWLGGDDDEISYIQQQVTVPSGSPSLVYWHWIDSQDECGYDFGGALINGSVVDEYNLCEAENTGGWVQHTVNLSAYAGQSVSLQIRVETDSSLISNLFVDDVSFQTSMAVTEVMVDDFTPTNALPKEERLSPAQR